jgi:hypothetical protein
MLQSVFIDRCVWMKTFLEPIMLSITLNTTKAGTDTEEMSPESWWGFSMFIGKAIDPVFNCDSSQT